MAREETENQLKLLAKTSIYIFVILIISKLLNYGYKIVIARKFGSETFGIFSLALIIISIATGILLLGLPDALVRYISFYIGKKQPSKIKAILKNSFILVSLSSLVALIFYFLFSDFIGIIIFKKPELSFYLKILSLSIPFTLFFYILLSLMRAKEKIGLNSFLNNVVLNSFKLILLFLFIYLGFSEFSILYSYVLSLLGVLLLTIYFSKKDLSEIFKSKSLNRRENRKILFEVLKYSWPLIFTSLIFNIYYWIDALVIGYFRESSAVGLYSAASTLIYLFAISQDLFIQLFFPMVARNHSENKRDVVREITKQVTKWMYLINLPLLFLMLIFPGILVKIFFGSEYISVASDLVRILSIGAVISSLNGIIINLLIIKGRTKLVLLDFSFFALLNLILDSVMILKFGLAGVAWATVISMTLLTLTLVFQLKKEFGFFPVSKVLIKISLFALIPFLLVLILSKIILPTLTNIVFLALFFVFSYILVLYKSRCFDMYDLEIFRAVLRKTGIAHFS